MSEKYAAWISALQAQDNYGLGMYEKARGIVDHLDLLGEKYLHFNL